ncbi:MAG: discoidin domain-containing protein [Bryobacteraceae bacterium]|nr:discoidin domain-containing protein [Bryobacteraceae bacterium]
MTLRTAFDKDSWAINEVRLLRQGIEILRTPAWRLVARPNPWEIDLAFDGNLATRWRSWESLRAGMHVEVGLGGLEELDQVTLICPLAPWDLKMELRGLSEAGRWEPLGGEPEHILGEEPQGLRRAATASFLRRGVNWLLISGSDFGAKDFEQRAAEWGLEFIAERNGARLYRIREP